MVYLNIVKVPDNPYHTELRAILSTVRSGKPLFNAIVNAPFKNKLAATNLGLSIVALLIVKRRAKTIDLVALSDTDGARGGEFMSVKRFHDIKIPVDDHRNMVAKAIAEAKPQQTGDWKHLFIPDLSPQEARFNQAGAGVESSVVYPLPGVRSGALIFSYYAPPEQIGPEHHKFMQAYAGMVTAKLREK